MQENLQFYFQDMKNYLGDQNLTDDEIIERLESFPDEEILEWYIDHSKELNLRNSSGYPLPEFLKKDISGLKIIDSDYDSESILLQISYEFD